MQRKLPLDPNRPLLSATQISLWKECQRKWAFKYLDRIVTPQGAGAELGVEVQDRQIDPWLGEGRELDWTLSAGKSAAVANELRPLLPKPKAPGLRLRRDFLMPSPSGRFDYQGEFDIYAPDSRIVPCIATPGRPLLGDIKTTKDLKYAKTEADLREDVQAMLYAMATMYEENVDELDAVWWYSRTQGKPKAQRTYTVVEAPLVVEQFGRIDEIGRELVAIKLTKPKTNDLPPTGVFNRDSLGRSICDAYGGCPFRSVCNLSPSVHAAAVNKEAVEMNGKTSDFLADLRKKAGRAVEHPAPVPASEAAPGVASAVEAIAPAVAAALPPWLAAAKDPMQGKIDASYSKNKIPPAINPPESTLPPAAPVGAVVESKSTPAAEQVAPPPGPDAALAPVKRGRGRPPKAAPAVETVPANAVDSDVAAAISDAFPKEQVAGALRALADWVSR